jgi:hypothetical protein
MPFKEYITQFFTAATLISFPLSVRPSSHYHSFKGSVTLVLIIQKQVSTTKHKTVTLKKPADTKRFYVSQTHV